MLGFGLYLTRYQTNSLLDSMKFLTAANLLLVSGIIITCVSFLGFIGALKENRCFLLTVCSLSDHLLIQRSSNQWPLKGRQNRLTFTFTH